MPEDIVRIDPDFKKIIPLCIKELEIKYPNYGNTWTLSDDKYYKERLFNEVEEYVKSTSVQSERRKLLNIINIAAMAYETARMNRYKQRYVMFICPACKKPLNDEFHEVINEEFVCVL